MMQRIDSCDARPLHLIAALIVISTGAALLSTAPVFSASMSCSGEEKTCIAACKKSLGNIHLSTAACARSLVVN